MLLNELRVKGFTHAQQLYHFIWYLRVANKEDPALHRLLTEPCEEWCYDHIGEDARVGHDMHFENMN